MFFAMKLIYGILFVDIDFHTQSCNIQVRLSKQQI